MNWNRHFLIIWLGWCQRRAKTATPEEKRHNCRWCVFPHSCVCVCVCLCVFMCRGNSCDVLNKLCFVANLRPSSERAHRHIYWWRRKLKTIEVGPTTKNEWKKKRTREQKCAVNVINQADPEEEVRLAGHLHLLIATASCIWMLVGVTGY